MATASATASTTILTLSPTPQRQRGAASLGISAADQKAQALLAAADEHEVSLDILRTGGAAVPITCTVPVFACCRSLSVSEVRPGKPGQARPATISRSGR